MYLFIPTNAHDKLLYIYICTLDLYNIYYISKYIYTHTYARISIQIKSKSIKEEKHFFIEVAYLLPMSTKIHHQILSEKYIRIKIIMKKIT